jgi:hypothetical protein
MNEHNDVINLGEASESRKCREGSCQEGGYRGKMILGGIVGGFSGALIVAGLFGFLLSHGKLRLPSSVERKTITEQQRVVTESDSAIVDAIAKSMPGVVSIVISKDVPKIRNFQSPFGGFPFFFNDPIPDRNGGTGSQKQQIGSGSSRGADDMPTTYTYHDAYLAALVTGRVVGARAASRENANWRPCDG